MRSAEHVYQQSVGVSKLGRTGLIFVEPGVNINWSLLPWRSAAATYAAGHGSVASLLRCGGMFNDYCFTNVVLSLTVKEF